MLDIILTLARLFRASNRELFMVGGTVRDLLLHRAGSPDVDLATDARPDEIKRLVAQTHPAAIVTVGEQFGTIRLHYERGFTTEDAEVTEEEQKSREDGDAAGRGRKDASAPGQTISAPSSSASFVSSAVSSVSPSPVVAEAPPGVDVVEITTYRSDRYDPASRKPEVTFGDTLEGDLLRRDFTINAMARDPLTGDVIDPYGGRADLERGLIRAVGDDPERRFDEDPLRMLRAARFAAQFGFHIEPDTAAAITRQAPTLAKISRERIRDEFTKLLVTLDPMLGLRLLVDLGLMSSIVPEVLELRGVSQAPGGHSKDVYVHVLRVVARTPPRPATRWAGLLHDIAKPRTRSVEEGQVHFFGHEDVGAAMARDILRRLKFDRPFIDHVTRLVKLHMRANAYLPDWTHGAVRRLMLDAGDALPDLLDLSRADITSYRQDKVARAAARVDELEARCRWLREEAERVPLKSPLDGNDLMRLFGREPGPWIRPVKDRLLDLVIDGRLAPDDRATAEAEARRVLAALERGEPVPPPALGTADAPIAAGERSADERPRTATDPRTAQERRAGARRQSRGAAGPGGSSGAGRTDGARADGQAWPDGGR